MKIRCRSRVPKLAKVVNYLAVYIMHTQSLVQFLQNAWLACRQTVLDQEIAGLVEQYQGLFHDSRSLIHKPPEISTVQSRRKPRERQITTLPYSHSHSEVPKRMIYWTPDSINRKSKLYNQYFECEKLIRISGELFLEDLKLGIEAKHHDVDEKRKGC